MLFSSLKYRMVARREERHYARQRAEKGFSDYDVFEIGTWFMTQFPRMLEDMRKHQLWIPSVVSAEYVSAHPGADLMNLDGEAQEAILKEWNKILDRTIACCDEITSGKLEGNEYMDAVHEVLAMFEKYYGDLGY